MPQRGRRPVWFATVVLTAATAGCAELGDFNRPRNSVWNHTILPAAGTVSAALRGEPLSRNAYTDDEDELRARAWRFVMPAHERAVFERYLAEYVRTNILPREALTPEPGSYLRNLRWEAGISPASRYRRLAEDILADRALLPPFCRLAARVEDADATRLRAIQHVRELDADEAEQARMRVRENRALVGWVGERLGHRLRTYRYALEHLVIETPQIQAVEPERALAALEETAACLDGLKRGEPRAVPARQEAPAARRSPGGPGLITGK